MNNTSVLVTSVSKTKTLSQSSFLPLTVIDQDFEDFIDCLILG